MAGNVYSLLKFLLEFQVVHICNIFKLFNELILSVIAILTLYLK